MEAGGENRKGHGVTERKREIGISQTGFKAKWLVTVCLGGQRLPWVRVRSDAGNLERNAAKTLQPLFDTNSLY